MLVSSFVILHIISVYNYSLKIVRDYTTSTNLPAKLLVTTAYKKNDGKIFGGQFMDGISSAVDPISMIRLAIFLKLVL